MGIESFNCVLNHRNAPAAVEQPFGREAYAKLRDHPEDDNLGIGVEAFDQFVGVPAGEDIEGLLLQENLLVGRKVRGYAGFRLVWDGDYFFGERFRNELRPGRSSYTMRREGGELGIILAVIAPMRDQKDTALAGGIGEPADIGEQAFGAGQRGRSGDASSPRATSASGR